MRAFATIAFTAALISLMITSCTTHVPATDHDSFEVCERNADQIRAITRRAAINSHLEIRTTPGPTIDGEKILSEFFVRANSDELVMYTLYNGSTFLYQIYGQKFESQSRYFGFRDDVVGPLSDLRDLCK